MRPSQRSHSIRPAASRRNSTRSPLRGPVSTAGPVGTYERQHRGGSCNRLQLPIDDELRRRRARYPQPTAVHHDVEMFERCVIDAGVLGWICNLDLGGQVGFAEAEEMLLATIGDRLPRLTTCIGVRQHRDRKTQRRDHFERRQHAGDRTAVFDEPMTAARIIEHPRQTHRLAHAAGRARFALHPRDRLRPQHARRIDRADVQRGVTHLIDRGRNHRARAAAAAPQVPAFFAARAVGGDGVPRRHAQRQALLGKIERLVACRAARRRACARRVRTARRGPFRRCARARRTRHCCTKTSSPPERAAASSPSSRRSSPSRRRRDPCRGNSRQRYPVWCVTRSRTVIRAASASDCRRNAGRYVRTRASRSIRPSSTSCISAVAVTVFDVEPVWNSVCAVTGSGLSTLVTPTPPA